MRIIWPCTLVALALAAGACSRKAPAEDPAFESRWKEITAASEAVVIGDDQALALSANVRKAQATLPSARAGSGLPEQPAGPDVDRVIRSNLGGVKGCYLTAARRSGRSGKAIVSFSIGSDGRPANVQVDA